MSDENSSISGASELTGKIFVATAVALCIVLVLVFLLHMYAKWLWHRRHRSIDAHNNRRHEDQHSGVTALRHGLDGSVLKTIPVIHFEPKDFKDGLECSVCLSELEEGEKARILPKCDHGFHAECIDMWFHSHTTCPVCRNPVQEQAEISVESLTENHQTQEESTNSGDSHIISNLTSELEEANNQHQAPILPFEPAPSSSSSQTYSDRPSKPDLAIDIPRHVVSEDEDEKTPVFSGMRSLRRILSNSRRFNPFSPRNNTAEGRPMLNDNGCHEQLSE